MPQEIENCVESVLEDNPDLSKSEAYAICHAQKADVATDVTESKFDPDELDWIAQETDIIRRAAYDGEIHWLSTDAEVHYRATSAIDSKGTEATLAGPLVTVNAGGADPIEAKSAAASASLGPQLPRQGDTNKIDTAALPEEFEQAVEADTFLVYGKASIEQYDEDDVPTMIEMDALEEGLDRFFGSKDAPGIISRGHQDVPVGRPIEEHELEESTTIALSEDETHTFEAGETLHSEVRDGDGDGRPEMWLLSQIANDTEIAKQSRIEALAGDLNGYSVTIRRNNDAVTPKGRRVTDLDFHAVTLGTDEQIRNKGSHFDVAEFKMELSRG